MVRSQINCVLFYINKYQIFRFWSEKINLHFFLITSLVHIQSVSDPPSRPFLSPRFFLNGERALSSPAAVDAGAERFLDPLGGAVVIIVVFAAAEDDDDRAIFLAFLVNNSCSYHALATGPHFEKLKSGLK